MNILSKEIVLVPLSQIKLNPKNRNQHSEDQIKQFAKILEYQGFRHPAVISNQTGNLVCGELRYLTLKAKGETHLPCMYQDYESDEQEFLHGVSDNEIAKQSLLDLSNIHVDIGTLGPFDLELLGIKDFALAPNFLPGTEDEQGQLDEKKPVECPACGHQFTT